MVATQPSQQTPPPTEPARDQSPGTAEIVPPLDLKQVEQFFRQQLARERVELRGCCRSAHFGQLAAALGKLQSQVSNPERTREVKVKSERTGQTYTFRYADLAECLNSVRPFLAEHGLAVLQSCTTVDGRAVVVTELLHSSEQYWRTEISYPGASGSDIKGLGGTFTYLRRYAICPILGIAPEDEDQVEAEPAEEDKKTPAGAGGAAGRAREAAAKERKPAQKQADKPAETASQARPAEQTSAPIARPNDQPDPKKLELRDPLWNLMQACDQVKDDKGQLDKLATKVKADWRLKGWGLPPSGDLTVEQMQQAITKYQGLEALLRRLDDLIDQVDGEWDKATGELLSEPTMANFKRRLWALAELHPGRIGRHINGKFACVEYCDEAQLRFVIEQTEQALFPKSGEAPASQPQADPFDVEVEEIPF